MDNNDSEQKAALGIIWAIVAAVVAAMLLLAGYLGLIAGKGGNQVAIAVSATAGAAAGPTVPAAVKIFFETGKSEAPVSATADVAAIAAYLKGSPAAKVVISGYHDAAGNADVNAELSKDRAKAVRAVLAAAGVEESRMTLDKPQVSLGGNDADARRVEVTIRQ